MNLQNDDHDNGVADNGEAKNDTECKNHQIILHGRPKYAVLGKDKIGKKFKYGKIKNDAKITVTMMLFCHIHYNQRHHRNPIIPLPTAIIAPFYQPEGTIVLNFAEFSKNYDHDNLWPIFPSSHQKLSIFKVDRNQIQVYQNILSGICELFRSCA